MTVSVETKHPSGLQEPKIIGKLPVVNGLQPPHQSAEQTNAIASASVPVLQGKASHHEGDSVNEDARAVLALRNLIFDICNQNGGGHGGSALGMAAIGVALYKHIMRYNPSDPSWFDRDRFVLSNG